MSNITLKSVNIIGVISIVLLLFIQFYFPFIDANEKSINAFNANTQYYNIHWGMNYFIFIMLIALIGFLLSILTLLNKHNFTYLIDLSIFSLGFAIIIGVMASLQSFFRENIELAIKENSQNALYSLSVIIPLMFISIINLYQEYKIKGERHIEKLYTPELKRKLKDQIILLESTILLNPDIHSLSMQPPPTLLLATTKEIIISTKPLTIIPFEKIKNLEQPIRGIEGKPTFSIITEKGETYDLIWAPKNRIRTLNFDKTLELYENIEKIIRNNK